MLEKSDKAPVYNPYENSKNSIRAKPKAEMAVKGGRARAQDPTSLKDKGNMHFKACEFDKAIDCYSECLAKLEEPSASMKEADLRELKVVIYSNRAMARLKRNQVQEAVEDCNRSLELNDRFIKSYLRRAEGYQRLRQWKKAKADYLKIEELEPGNATIVPELKRVNKVLENAIEEAHSKLVAAVGYSSMPTERIEIVEVE